MHLSSFLAYIGTEKGLSKNTIEAYGRDLRFFLAFITQEKKKNSLEMISHEDIISYISSIKSKNYAGASLSRMFISIKVFFRFMKKEGAVDKDVTQFLELPKTWQLIPCVMSYSEVELLLLQPDVTTYLGARDKAILELLYATGIRVTEACDIKIKDVNDTFIKVMGKGGKERLIPIGKKAIDAIDYYLANFRDEDTMDGYTHTIFKAKITDWRSQVDCVMIDTAYDGKVFNVSLSDVPARKNDLVDGNYELSAPGGRKTKVAVKIIDMLGEEVLVVEEK